MQQKLELYIVPLGSSMRDEFCKILKQLSFGAGVLILPTGLLQEQAKEKYNVEVSGFDTLANKILNLNSYAYLEEVNYRSQQLIVKEILDYYASREQFHYLAGLKDKRGFVKHMTALLSQLSRSGAEAKEIVAALKSWDRSGNLGRKDQEIALVYKGYRDMLKLQKRFDLEGKYRLALKILREQDNPKLPWQVIYVSDFATLDALQLELLQELAKHCQVKVGLCYEKDKETCAVSQTTLEQLQKSCITIVKSGARVQRKPALQHLVEHLGSKQICKEAFDAEKSVMIREYRHQQAEIKGVLAEIKQELLGGARLKDYAVAVYDLGAYTGLRLVADEYGLPITLPRAEQLLVQPLTEFVLQLLAAVPDNRQGVEAYFNLLSSGLGKLLFNSNLESMESLRETTFFKQRSAVQHAVTVSFERVELPKFLLKVDNFLINCKSQDSITGYVEALTDFIAKLNLAKELGTLYKQDLLALDELKNILSTEKRLLESLLILEEDYEKCGMAEQKYTLQEFVECWQDGLKEISVKLEEGRKDGLLVTNAVQLQGTSFKKVYLLGLREGVFPARNRENWLYNDKERGELQALGIDLPNTYNAYAADYCLFAGAVAAATEKLVLSFYKDDEGEESPYVDEVIKLFPDIQADLVEKKELASFEEALGQSYGCKKSWLEKQVGALTLEAARIDQQRTGVYDGKLEEQELLEGLQGEARNCFSASGLGQYVSCPFKYLGTQLWQQKDKEEKSEQLDGGTRGSLFHETVAMFVESYLQKKPDFNDKAKLWQQVLNCYEAKVEQFQAEGKIINNEYWPMEAKQLERMLSWWLAYELTEQEQWDAFKPIALEKSFGKNMIRLETSSHKDIYLVGRADRIDGSEEAIFITDYKSGDAPGNGDFEKGKDLQMAFYLLAAEQLYPGKTVLGGNYLSLKKGARQGGIAWQSTGNPNIKVNGKKNAPTFTSWEEVKQLCENMIIEPVSEIYKGIFTANPKDELTCKYCPLKDICRYNILKQNTVANENKEVKQNGKTEAD